MVHQPISVEFQVHEDTLSVVRNPLGIAKPAQRHKGESKLEIDFEYSSLGILELTFYFCVIEEYNAVTHLTRK